MFPLPHFPPLQNRADVSTPAFSVAPRYVHVVCTKLGVFGVGQSNGVIQIYPWALTDPCCHGNHPPLFEQKIGYNSACMEDTTSIPRPSRGLSGSANLTVLVKFVPDQTLLPWQRKFENFGRKLTITRLVWEIRPPFLNLVGGNRGRRI